IPSDDEPSKTSELSMEFDKGQIEDDLTIDMDSLDIELEETNLDDMLADQAAIDDKNTKSKSATDNFDDEDIKLNLDELDLDIDDVQAQTDKPTEDGLDEIPELSMEFDKGQIEDDLTIDMDSLDIELEEINLDDALADHAAMNDKKNIKSELSADDFDEEDIKINLDELDLDIDEIEGIDFVSEDDTKADKSIDYEDDEKLTLDDAGLTFDELTLEAKDDGIYEQSDDEIKLTLEDIDPDLTLEEIIKTAETDNKLVLDTLEEFPEVYSDENDAIIQTRGNRNRKETPANIYMDSKFTDNSDYDIDYSIIEDFDDSELQGSSNAKRDISFSIDFSLKYSGIQAFLRLFFLYFISMIPHFIVLFIYTALSAILGFINQLVILSTGKCAEDFSLIIENTLRYVFYIKTNLIGIVDDRPVFAGRKYIDHALQFDVALPLSYSKNMAILRVSIIGIIIFALPHIIMMTLLSLIAPICYLIGMLSVIFTKRWPRIFFIYLAKYFRYLARISSFMLGLTDDYPSFKF
ncbi:MAG: DUF4389 domain-containing protein, partial [Leptospirales bacterium]|nr:DUF4389 domain-containing protein [Leptospirales bacterium]